MRKASGLVIVTCLAVSGCLSGFQHPLGPAADGFIEPQLVGRWKCASADDPSPSLITILDFDGKQYFMQVESEKEEPGRYRAYATRVEEMPFLNIRAIGPKADDEWTILQYALVDPGHMVFRHVDPQPFEDVIDDAPSVSARLGSLLQDPEVLQDLLSCTRAAADD